MRITVIIAVLFALPLPMNGEKPYSFETTPGKLPKQVVPLEYAIRIVPNKAPVFHERHGVALQAVARRMATGRQACRDHPRTGRKHRAMGGELLGAFGEGGKTGSSLPHHEIAAQTIEDDENSARHV